MTGEVFTIPDVGLVNLNARIYDPELGRMMSADPTIPDPFASQSLNRFSYVGNGPLSAIDPTGLDAEPPVAEIVVTGTRRCDSCTASYGNDFLPDYNNIHQPPTPRIYVPEAQLLDLLGIPHNSNSPPPAVAPADSTQHQNNNPSNTPVIVVTGVHCDAGCRALQAINRQIQLNNILNAQQIQNALQFVGGIRQNGPNGSNYMAIARGPVPTENSPDVQPMSREDRVREAVQVAWEREVPWAGDVAARVRQGPSLSRSELSAIRNRFAQDMAFFKGVIMDANISSLNCYEVQSCGSVAANAAWLIYQDLAQVRVVGPGDLPEWLKSVDIPGGGEIPSLHYFLKDQEPAAGS